MSNKSSPLADVSGFTVTLETARASGICPMVDVIHDDGQWITYRGTFGGRKIKRSKRSRVAKILQPCN